MEALTKETKQLLKRYLAAAANLYGIIPLYKLLEIYNSQNEPISEAQFLDFTDSVNFDKEYFDVFGEDEIIKALSENEENEENEEESEAFENAPEFPPMRRELLSEYLYAFGDFDDYFKISAEQMGKSFYIPEKDKFLRYEDDMYFEKTLEFISMRSFIRSQSQLTKQRADEIAEEVQFSFKIDDCDPDIVIRAAVNLGVRLKDEKMYDEFFDLCCEVMRNTRMHIHRGHTPLEIHNGGF